MFKKVLWSALVLIGPLALARNTIATARLDWFHPAGQFHCLDNGHHGDSWVESVGGVRYQYQEYDRNPDYVEIHDDTRGVAVRMFKDHSEVKFATEPVYRRAYTGNWDTRRIFYNIDSPNQRPYFMQIQNNQFMYQPAGTASPLFFDVVDRNDSRIIIQGHGRKYFLMDEYVSYQDGGDNNAIQLYFQGFWDETANLQ